MEGPMLLTWVSAPLDAPLTLRGPVVAKLFAETTGSDADWVVKLIDVFPTRIPPVAGLSADVKRRHLPRSLSAELR